MYDAIVVGARCAGASVAMLLGRRGYKVLLVDRSPVGSDIPHGHFIHRGGPQRLAKWGILDQVKASGCQLVSEVTMVIGGVPLTADLEIDGIPFGCAPRRSVLDKILADNAVAAGVELRDRFVVDEFLMDGERVVGINGRDLETNQRFSEYGRIVIGADGRNSRLAQAVQAPTYEAVPSVSCYYFSYWAGVPAEALEIHVGLQQVIFTFPTNDDLLGVFVAWPIEQFHAVRSDLETHFWAALDKAPTLAARVRAGQQVDRFYGTADLPNFFRKPYGPGWALVGDAGHHKDPYMALGISDALRDADYVSEAVHQGLSGVRPMDEALAEFEQKRNAESMASYHENLARATFTPPPPEVRQLRAALVTNNNPQDNSDFYKAAFGLMPPQMFFNPQTMGRIMQAAAQIAMA